MSSSLRRFRFSLQPEKWPCQQRVRAATVNARTRCRPRLVACASARTEPRSAKEAIESGLVLFKDKKSYAEAVQQFSVALELQPDDDEARAALYNMGCAYAKLRQYKPAADAIVKAINDHRLKLSVALQDEDLRDLRDRREWIDALTLVKGGLSREMKIDLRTEAKAPFRFSRVFLFGGLAVGAAIGLLIISGRLALAFRGGEGAPEMMETVQNFAINSAVLAVLAVLLSREARAKARAVEISDREDLLSRLQVDLGKGRVLPLLRFRGQVRPVLLAGSKAFVDRSLRDAEPFMLKLRERGVSVVPLVLKTAPSGQPELDPSEKILRLKREFQRKESTSKGFGDSKTGGRTAREEPGAAGSTSTSPEGGVTEEDRKWKLEPYDVDEWQAWIERQKEFANVSGEKRNCFIQVQLDGTVRSSALGPPNWAQLVDALPPLNDIRTSLSDGVGTSI